MRVLTFGFAATLLWCHLVSNAPHAADRAPVEAVRPAAEPKEPLAGHSMHGEAFNEGARQKAYLMGGTGKVTFPATTGSPLAQRFINQGVGQLHGFWYFEAERSFRQAAAIDPDCAVAYWGMAMANANNAKRAKGFLAEAVKRKAGATERERLYIDALDTYVNGKVPKGGNKSRILAKAFENIAKRYPHDIEAKAFRGLMLYKSRSAKPAVKYEDVDQLLREVLAVEPLHPCHHYIIHLWDHKDAAKALASAALCGESSPAIAHMWHMPGHTYSRLKRYRDAVWQQEASARVDHAHMIRDRVLPDQIHNFAHNNEWLLRNLIFVGRVHDAVDLAKNMIELPRHPKYNTLAKRGSTQYGRLRLFQVLYEYELWDETIALCQSPYLEPTDRNAEQIKRLRYLGRAHYLKGNAEEGDKLLAELEGRLKDEKLKVEKSKRKDAKSKRKRGGKARRNSNDVRTLQQAVDELKGRKAVAAGDFKTGIPLVKKSGGISTMDTARLQLQSGDHAEAEKTLRNYLKSHKNETLPLAHLVEVLWTAGKKDEAKKEFTELRTVAGEADRDAPCLKRLAPVAAELGWPKDWRTPAPRPDDFGKRPALDSLGPFRWSPGKAPGWTLEDVDGKSHSLQDYRGKPVVVIFYLGFGCLHCAEQLQAFAPKAEEFRKAGFELIAVSTDDRKQLKQSHENYRDGKFPFPLVADPKLDVFKKYRCYDDFEKFTLHGTFVIDAGGMIRWQDVGFEPFMDADFVLKEAQRLLEQRSVAGESGKSAVPTNAESPADSSGGD